MAKRRPLKPAVRRLHLLPDTDGEIRAVAEGLEELLLVCRSDDPNEDPELFPDPGDAVTRPAIDVGAEAVGRIAVALRAADDAPTPRMLAPDGHYELVPLRRVELDDEDLERMGGAVRELERATLPAGDELVAEYLREGGAPWSPPSPLPRGVADPAQEVVARAGASTAYSRCQTTPTRSTSLSTSLTTTETGW